MINKNAEPPAEPASSDTSSADRSPVDCPEIVPSSIDERADASGDALNDDEEQWLSTVLTSLQTRSAEVREALGKALLNGRKGVGPLLAPFLVKVGLRALRPGYRREPMRQRVHLSLDRDLPGTNANLLYECPHDLLAFGVVATDEAVTHDLSQLANGRQSYPAGSAFDLLTKHLGGLAKSTNLGAVRLNSSSDVGIARTRMSRRSCGLQGD